MVHIGEHIDLLVGLDNPVDHSRRLYALLRTEATADSWNQLELTADEYFNILDYTGAATRLFADPEFDGYPALITEENIDEAGETIAGRVGDH
jgi:hypothetical protein